MFGFCYDNMKIVPVFDGTYEELEKKTVSKIKDFVKTEVEKEIKALEEKILLRTEGGYFEVCNEVFIFPPFVSEEERDAIVEEVRSYFEDKGFNIEVSLRVFAIGPNVILPQKVVFYNINWKETK